MIICRAEKMRLHKA